MRDDLPQAMRETARQLEPDVVRLAAGGVERGARMRRVERAVQVLGSTLAVAVVCAAVVLFGSHRATEARAGGSGGGVLDQPAVSVDATPPATSLASTPSQSSGSAGGPKVSGSQVSGNQVSGNQVSGNQVSGNELISILKASLEGTGVAGSSYTARGTDLVTPTNMIPLDTIVVGARLSAQDNIGSISIVISGGSGHVSGPGVPQPRADGSSVYVSQIPESTDQEPGADRTTLEVTLVRPDGSSLLALETNSPNEKSAAVPGAPLLLTADQVTAVLDSPVWDAAVAAAKDLPRPARALT